MGGARVPELKINCACGVSHMLLVISIAVSPEKVFHDELNAYTKRNGNMSQFNIKISTAKTKFLIWIYNENFRLCKIM